MFPVFQALCTLFVGRSLGGQLLRQVANSCFALHLVVDGGEGVFTAEPCLGRIEYCTEKGSVVRDCMCVH